jgi:hypothetical protein
MNDCSGNGVCSPNNGECQCNKGWVSADCSKRLEVLTPFYTKTKTIVGAEWHFFTYTDALYYKETYEFTLQSGSPMDIYITQGANVAEN